MSERAKTDGGPAFPIEVLHEKGMSHRDYAAIHADQPGIAEIVSMAGFTYSAGQVWSGPSHLWRDGWVLYHWHGVKVPAHWIENRETLDPNEVIRAENVEQRAAGAAIIGWPRMLSVLKAKVINDSGNGDIGQLIELTLPGLPEPGRFLKAECPRNGIIVEGVPRISDIDGLPIDTALAAQAWRIGDPQSEYMHPPRRT